MSRAGVFEELVREFGEKTIDEFSSCFMKHADYHGTIGMRDVSDCLYWLGKNPSKRIMKACIKADHFNIDEKSRLTFGRFVQFIQLYRSTEESLFEPDADFADADLNWFKEIFNQYSKRTSTRTGGQQKGVRGADLWHCLHAMGREPETEEDRVRVMRWVEKAKGQCVEKNGNNHLDFHTFLRVLRYMVDDEVESSRRRERELIARAYFNDDELQGFKAVFDSLDESGDGEIPLQQMKRLFENLGLKLNRSQMQELVVMIREVDENDSLAIDFGEFSLLMRKLVDKNFAGLNDAASDMLKKEKVIVLEQNDEMSRKSSYASCESNESFGKC